MRNYNRRHWPNINLVKIDTGEGLIHLQIAVFTGFRIGTVPVVQAKRNVTVFLYLKNYGSSQRMHRTRMNKHCIADVWYKAVKPLGYPIVLNSFT